jgi:hypothetical protein
VLSKCGDWLISNLALAPAFPHEVFHDYIIPDILSDYVHNILVKAKTPDWQPFYTLRLVSRDFNESCLTLWSNIFGLEEYDES